jgi:hypothetical protein
MVSSTAKGAGRSFHLLQQQSAEHRFRCCFSISSPINITTNSTLSPPYAASASPSRQIIREKMSAANEKPMHAPQQHHPDLDLERGGSVANAECLHTEVHASSSQLPIIALNADIFFLFQKPELPLRPVEEARERGAAAPADAQQPLVHICHFYFPLFQHPISYSLLQQVSAPIENASLLAPDSARSHSPFHRRYWQRHNWRHIHWHCSTPCFVYFTLICWMASFLIWIGLTTHNLVLYFHERDPYPRYLRLGWLMAQLMVCYLLMLQ